MPWPRLRLLMVAAFVVLLIASIWPLNVFDVRARSPFASVASAFSPAPGYPGYRWSRDGRETSELELNTIAGPSHCPWEAATMLLIGWRAGTVAPTAATARMYVRDPQGVYGPPYRDRLDLHATLRRDATPTGYRLGAIELYFSVTDQDDAIYLVAPSGAERWPRVEPMRLCA